MNTVSYVLEFTIKDGKVDEFKSMAAGYISTVKENEPGTLGYQWFLGESGNRCLLLETFSSSDAMLTHLANVGPSLPDLLAIAPITRVEVLGTVSDEARDALAALDAAHFPHFDGFDR
ncbi:MAG: antibiotic biosynthesis monooxygenase [Candidatus Krumholzibacteria bacterium]|nr:antibiotic biosynthesis monooxygenase [Candidatus Krumholzibacteria bacterium]